MRLGRGWIAAPLLAVVLLVAVVGSVSAADGSDEFVVSADQSGELGVVVIAQSDLDPESDTERRLVDRETSERVDGVVIALWSIAAGMTVMLVVFLWHTSPRRRLRLARRRSTERYEPEGAEPEDSTEDEPAEDSEAVEGELAEAAEGESAEAVERELDEEAAAGEAVEAVEGESAAEPAGEAGAGEFVEAVELDSAEEAARGDAPSQVGTNRGSVPSRLWAWLKDLT